MCAFTNCINLQNVSLPCLTAIGEHAFENCINLQKLNFNNPLSLDNYCFSGCNNLVSLNFLYNVTSDGWVGTIMPYTFSYSPFDWDYAEANNLSKGYLYVKNISIFTAATNWTALNPSMFRLLST